MKIMEIKQFDQLEDKFEYLIENRFNYSWQNLIKLYETMSEQDKKDFVYYWLWDEVEDGNVIQGEFIKYYAFYS